MEQTTQPTIDFGELKRTARIAGALYLVLFVAGIFAEFFVRSAFIVPGDAVATAANIAAAEGLFRTGIAADLVMIIADVALAILFYELLKPVSRTLALLAGFFRLAQAATLGMNLLTIFLGLELLSGAGYLATLGGGASESLALVFLGAHGTGYALALVFFGVNLAILGVLIARSGYMPRLLGILLVVAAFGYLLDSFARALLVNYESYAPIFDAAVFGPAFVAELAISLWLVIRGVRTKPR